MLHKQQSSCGLAFFGGAFSSDPAGRSNEHFLSGCKSFAASGAVQVRESMTQQRPDSQRHRTTPPSAMEMARAARPKLNALALNLTRPPFDSDDQPLPACPYYTSTIMVRCRAPAARRFNQCLLSSTTFLRHGKCLGCIECQGQVRVAYSPPPQTPGQQG